MNKASLRGNCSKCFYYILATKYIQTQLEQTLLEHVRYNHDIVVTVIILQ